MRGPNERECLMTRLPMYAAIMGDTFLRLSAPVQQFHRLTGRQVLHGWVTVSAPVSWPAKLLALILGTPLTASHGRIKFELRAEPQVEPQVETWPRYFPTKTMCSTLTRNGATVVESKLIMAANTNDAGNTAKKATSPPIGQ